MRKKINEQLLKINYHHSQYIIRVLTIDLSITQSLNGRNRNTLDTTHYYF